MRYLAQILHRHGIRTRTFYTSDGRASLYARLEGARADGGLLLLHHVDVVPAGEGWSRPAFSGETVAGELWGRGAIDVKSLGVAHLAAFLDLAEHRDELARDVVVPRRRRRGERRGARHRLAARAPPGAVLGHRRRLRRGRQQQGGQRPADLVGHRDGAEAAAVARGTGAGTGRSRLRAQSLERRPRAHRGARPDPGAAAALAAQRAGAALPARAGAAPRRGGSGSASPIPTRGSRPKVRAVRSPRARPTSSSTACR